MTIAGSARRKTGVSSFILAFVGALQSGCTFLPVAGPGSTSIVTNSDSVLETDAAPSFPYVFVDLTEKVLANIPQTSPESFYSTFGLGKGRPPVTQIGTGDVIQITIFESAAGGLFVPNDAGARPGNYVQLPQQAVDSTGSINVPYAGVVRVTGRSIDEIASDVEKRLANRAIEPKVVVNLVSQRASEVSIVGAVNAPNKITISPSGDRLLDAVARAGGISGPGYDTYVSLTRNGRTATVYFPLLVSNARENIYLQTADTIYVSRKPKTFVALGAIGLTSAVGANSTFNFETDTLYLTEAVGRAGGLNDSRADPRQVFIYRFEDEPVLKRLRVTPPAQRIGPGVPTVYRIDLAAPSGFFSASQFRIRDRDVIYVANAGAVDYLKFLSVLNQSVTNYNAVKSIR